MTTTIYCTDGSELATRAAQVANSVLRPAEFLVVATVVETPDQSMLDGMSGFAGGTMSEDEFMEATGRVLDAGVQIVADLVEKLGLDAADRRVLTGDPRDALCELAEEVSASTVVVGSRGRSGLKRAFLGSVSDYLVRNAPCAVLVVGG